MRGKKACPGYAKPELTSAHTGRTEMNMPRKLCLVLCLIVGLALAAPLAADAGRIGFKNETTKQCYGFKWQSMLWAKVMGKWIANGPPIEKAVKPGQTYIYEGIIDGIQYVEYMTYSDADCAKPSSNYKRVWSTSAPAAWTTLNVIVDQSGNVDVKQLRQQK